jgi:hypothetical protein
VEEVEWAETQFEDGARLFLCFDIMDGPEIHTLLYYSTRRHNEMTPPACHSLPHFLAI